MASSTFILVGYYGDSAAYFDGREFSWELADAKQYKSKKVASRKLEKLLDTNPCLLLQEVVTRTPRTPPSNIVPF